MALVASCPVAFFAAANLGFQAGIIRLRIVAHGAAIYATSGAIMAVSVSHLSLLYLVAFSVCVLEPDKHDSLSPVAVQ